MKTRSNAIAFLNVAVLIAASIGRADLVYVANTVDPTIEKFDSATGVDLGVFGDASDGLGMLGGLAFDTTGNLYAANSDKNTIVRFTPTGNAEVFASTGLNSPNGLAFDPAGNLYVANMGDSTIVKFGPNGVGTVFANSGMSIPRGLAFDQYGNLYVANEGNGTIQKFAADGSGTLFASLGWMKSPNGLTFDRDGNLYVGCSGSIMKLTPAGDISSFVSTGIMSACGVGFDSSGNLYVADTGPSIILRYTPDGLRSEFTRSPHVGHPTFFAIQTSTNNAAAHDVIFYTINKTQHCWQSDTGLPVERPYSSPAGHHYAWHARAQVFFTALANIASAFTGAAATTPSSQLVLSTDQLALEFLEDDPTQEFLDANVADGTYTILMNTVHEGSRSVDLTLTGSDYPPAPHIANFTALQTVNPAADARINWKPVAGSRETDFIQAGVMDTNGAAIFQTPFPNQADVLSGTNVSALVPAGVLKANATYIGYVIYAKVKQAYTAPYPGVLGISWYGRITQFPLATTSAMATSPCLAASVSANKITLSWPISATGFVLQTSGALSATGQWEVVTNGIAAIGSNWVFTADIGPASGFFRLQRQ